MGKLAGTARWAALVLSLVSAPGALAWGPDGHRIIAWIAEPQLTERTRQEVDALLQGESLDDASVWADTISRSRRETRAWHYVPIPRNATVYDAGRDCADSQCIVAALGRSWWTLADRNQPPPTRADALRFVLTGSPAEWATEAHLVAVRGAYTTPDGRAFLDANRRTLEDQLMIAGVRLASILNTALDRGKGPPGAGSSVKAPDAEPPADFIVTRLTWLTSLWSIAGGAVLSYILGLIALLILASRRGSRIVSRHALTRAATAPLRLQPWSARWILLIGYSARLIRRQAVTKAAAEYFGVPAVTDEEEEIVPDADGAALHQAIAAQCRPQEPLFLAGPGGAGKSTILARLAWLGATGHLPAGLTGYTPILITASDYSGDLIQAAGAALRERDGVGLPNDRDAVVAFLQAGNFLILFDGWSEIFTDPDEALRDLLRTASSTEMRDCRFIVATRPVSTGTERVRTLHLRPLTAGTIEQMIGRYGLTEARQNTLRAQLASFGDRAIEPLLFAMMIEASRDESVARTRASLYQRYFCRLLRTEESSLTWMGWQDVLSTLAAGTVLTTGRRGGGWTHEELIDRLSARTVDGVKTESVPARLQRLYGFEPITEIGIVNTLARAGLLIRDRRWRFAHDTFEEFFAAMHIVSRRIAGRSWTAPESWRTGGVPDEMANVRSFVIELDDAAILEGDPFFVDETAAPMEVMHPLELKRHPTRAIAEVVPTVAPEIPVQRAGTPLLLPLDLLTRSPAATLGRDDLRDVSELGSRIETLCRDAGVVGKARVIRPGPVITSFQFTPTPGIKYGRLVHLAGDLAPELGVGPVRIERISGTATLAIEVPNRHPRGVTLGDIIASPYFAAATSPLTLALGVSTNGEPFTFDLALMPHLLIGGAGTQTSVRAALVSLLYRGAPSQLRLVVLDPAGQMTMLDGLPHMNSPVITDTKHAIDALEWGVKTMERRYLALAEAGVRNATQFNAMVARRLDTMVVCVTELRDLMEADAQRVESAVSRLAQKARAVAIHLIIATETVSPEVITRMITANFPTRIAHRMATRDQSRAFLETTGAEKLLPRNDALFLPPGSSRLLRIHPGEVTEEELGRVVAAAASRRHE